MMEIFRSTYEYLAQRTVIKRRPANGTKWMERHTVDSGKIYAPGKNDWQVFPGLS
jgi:hypothetical protein